MFRLTVAGADASPTRFRFPSLFGAPNVAATASAPQTNKTRRAAQQRSVPIAAE
jgi:hypothetical protein